jgi:hypothetical protein
MAIKVITANSFSSGEVIYLGMSGWVGRIEEAQLFNSEKLIEEALCQANSTQHQLVSPYVIDVKTDQGCVIPVSVREQIRALGPSNYYHGKQAGDEAHHVSVH